jgi:hypothetical protein
MLKRFCNSIGQRSRYLALFFEFIDVALIICGAICIEYVLIPSSIKMVPLIQVLGELLPITRIQRQDSACGCNSL